MGRPDTAPHDDQLSTVADLVGFLKGPRLNQLRDDQRDPVTTEVIEPGFTLVALLVQKHDGSVGCELRSADDSALDLARLLGGGGHEHAAGARRAGTLEQVRAEILAWAAPRLATNA